MVSLVSSRTTLALGWIRYVRNGGSKAGVTTGNLREDYS
jgi:hypothetical protein